jgi:chromosome segregation ATPase
MSDEELVKRLRKLADDMEKHAASDWDEHEDVASAADRIEQLERLTRGQGEQLEIQGNKLARLSSHGHEQAARIETLTEQLEAARADAKEAEAYAEELEEKLRARTAERNHANDVTDAAIEEVNRLKALLAECLERNDLLEARLGKAVEALERIGKGDYRINNVPDYVKDPQPTAKDIARTTLSALLNDVAEGKAEIEGSHAS